MDTFTFLYQNPTKLLAFVSIGVLLVTQIHYINKIIELNLPQ